VGHLTNWVKAMPLSSTTANGVVKMLLDNIIPWFGLIENIDSNNGSHFTANIIRELARALGIRWEYHTPWYPPSSGKVERMSQTLKVLVSRTKLVLETRLPWIKCLPLALLKTRMPPRRTGISPYEMLYGVPYLGWPSGLPSFKTKDHFLQNYVLSLSSALSSLRQQGLLAQIPPLEFPVHPHWLVDYILIWIWSGEKLKQSWEGPYQVLLTTETA
jgi:hypothetical protein